MTKYLVCVSTIAVLLGGVTANLLMCVGKQMAPIMPYNLIFNQPDIVCQDTEEMFRQARSRLRNCFSFDIDIDITRLESLHNELCNPYSDFRQKVERQRECLSSDLIEDVCASIRKKIMDPKHELLNLTNVDNSINIICQSLADEMIRCGENVGRPCGIEGKEVVGRMVEVLEPFYKGICLYTARFGRDGSVPLDDFENKFVYSSTRDSNPFSAYTSTVDGNPFSVYTSTVDSDSYAASAVTVHSFTYYLLIGLIFIVNC